MSLQPAQRRTVIIRGRGQRELDTLLPVFANLVERNTPLVEAEFRESMLANLSSIFPDASIKTLKNYLTEIVGQLFSMYYIEEGKVEISPLTLKLIEDRDQPAFFKVLASRLQFPNPSAKQSNYDKEVADGLNVRPLVLVLELLKAASLRRDQISFQEMAYYVLNSLEALTGKHSGSQLFATILRARAANVELSEFHGSRAQQHIQELLKILLLANLVQTDSQKYWLNSLEMTSINAICASPANANLFRLRTNHESHKDFQNAWRKYLGDVTSLPYDKFATSIESLGVMTPKRVTTSRQRSSSAEIGREGELMVLELENRALENAFPGRGLVAQDFTAMRGIGFDIKSVFHNEHALLGKPHHIEVKSTKRVTKPDLASSQAPDCFTLTRSEMKALKTYKEFFSIYRVYLFSGGFVCHVLRNPSNLNHIDTMNFSPENWTVEYVPSAIPESCQVVEE